MGLKKKKNIIFLTLCMVVCFILYQLYFFLTISSENNNRAIPVLDHNSVEKFVHIHSELDKFINENGVIRGVLFHNMPKYRPDSQNNFRCLKAEHRIPFDQVNDDYCDCEDGTDEPSTTACVNGTFYCDTQRHKSASFNYVPSNRVNDGICDCCDGSDEWLYEPNKQLLSQSNLKHYTYYVTKCHNACK